MKYIYKIYNFLLRILPILILIFFVFLLHYKLRNEGFFTGNNNSPFAKIIKKAQEEAEQKCKDQGYDSCAHKKEVEAAEAKCKTEYYQLFNSDDAMDDCENKKRDGKKKFYKSCKHKAKELECIEQGYEDCDAKAIYLKEIERREKMEETERKSELTKLRSDLLTNPETMSSTITT